MRAGGLLGGLQRRRRDAFWVFFVVVFFLRDAF